MMRPDWPRVIAAGVVAYVVAVASLTLLFGNPLSERLLFTPAAGQSPKVLAVWLEQPPLPAVTPLWADVGSIDGRGLAVQALLLAWALGLALVYALGWRQRPGPAWRRGLAFGVAMWAVVFVFFEAWVPFNVLGEPFHLVAFELALELVAMSLTGVAIAVVYRPAAAND
jgi:hypothetical protein